MPETRYPPFAAISSGDSGRRSPIRVGEVPSSNLGAPIALENREQPRTRANIPENAGHRGSVFARVRGCSWVWRPQTDRSGREKGPQKDCSYGHMRSGGALRVRSRWRHGATLTARGENWPPFLVVASDGKPHRLAIGGYSATWHSTSLQQASVWTEFLSSRRASREGGPLSNSSRTCSLLSQALASLTAMCFRVKVTPSSTCSSQTPRPTEGSMHSVGTSLSSASRRRILFPQEMSTISRRKRNSAIFAGR